MFPKTLAEHVEFHLLLWAGLFRVASELMSWPCVTSRSAVRYNSTKDSTIEGGHSW